MRSREAVLYRKEWRADAAMLAVMVASLLLVRLVTWIVRLSPHVPEGALSLMAAMIGARLLAGERETGTHAFLMQLPVSATAVWRAKLWAALSWVFVLYVVTYAGADEAALLTSHPSYFGEPYAFIAPIVLLGAAAIASSVLDNTMLAFAAGVVIGLACQTVAAAIGERTNSAFLYGNGTLLLAVLLPLITLILSGACLFGSRAIFVARCRESRG